MSNEGPNRSYGDILGRMECKTTEEEEKANNEAVADIWRLFVHQVEEVEEEGEKVERRESQPIHEITGHPRLPIFVEVTGGIRLERQRSRKLILEEVLGEMEGEWRLTEDEEEEKIKPCLSSSSSSLSIPFLTRSTSPSLASIQKMILSSTEEEKA